ncbi:DUF3515 domain-containing protein [Occultella glacieicola]|uniref:DUF3515 domain-containing protein n=1 Tax=Occultella glacieicola TaxID=2518684 RepID=UPI001F2C6F2E|nr:DUF3515 domain-containing protein [Occultella glacieicola]
MSSLRPRPGTRPTGRRGVRAAATTAAVALVWSVAGCATPVTLEPAPTASEPVCADVLIALPDTLAGADRRSTTSQASRAWGDPPITLRCGVTPPGPTTDRCITAEADDGSTVDWVVADLADDDTGSESGSWTFTTYGRTPAIEVVVPVEYAGEDATSVLISLNGAVSVIPQERACL